MLQDEAYSFLDKTNRDVFGAEPSFDFRSAALSTFDVGDPRFDNGTNSRKLNSRIIICIYIDRVPYFSYD